MMLLNLDQRSSEWHVLRRSKIGASDCPAILGKSPYKGHTPYGIWKNKVIGEEVQVTSAMQRGSDLESEALAKVCETLGYEFKPVVALSSEKSWQMASLDGYNADRNTLIEIKCPGAKTLASLSNGNIPENWIWQIQHQLSVTGCEEAVLYAYDGESGMLFSIVPDEEKIHELLKAEERFWFKNVIEMEPPELLKGDYVERNDEKWAQLAQDRLLIQGRMKDLEALEKANREALIALADGASSEGAGVKLTKYFTKGRIAYESIPLLEGLNLDVYRKAGKESWRIS